MNCTHHPDQAAVAYCRTCGKALCNNCTRPVRGVIYCEDCLGARMESAGGPSTAATPGAPQPATVYQQVMDQGLGMKVPPPPPAPPAVPLPPAPASSGPNPTVAGILAGFFPFGVGAVYTGQYAKGLAHLVIFGLLCAGCSASDHGGGEALGIISGLGLAFFWVYQIVDAVRSARALQAGLAPPDPYGLAATFGGGVGTPGSAKPDASKVPVSAIVLILLGVLFLLHTAGFFEHGFDTFWPVLLIGLGVWLFARNYGMLGSAPPSDAHYWKRRLMGPVMLFVIGGLFLLENLNGPSLHRTWPVILLAVGAVKLFQGGSGPRMGSGTTPPGAGTLPPSGGTVPPSVPPPPVSSTSTEVKNG